MHSEEKPQRVRHNRYTFKGRIQRNPALHTYHDDEQHTELPWNRLQHQRGQ